MNLPRNSELKFWPLHTKPETGYFRNCGELFFFSLIFFLLKVNHYEPLCPSVGLLVGWSVGHAFLKGRKVTLPCSNYIIDDF